ncbi:winged helix-turn-helix domain-containing protein [Bradyrhizobium liaoningense]|uniref:ATP-binding protein n=1 Tax=Bradyrhizobium liaoningense TaxID=43992 RepID=UPI001BADC134|nr:winged helix-turn-helix domain-containing protein [Bradyrhizobium liaoningense]MBR0845625.1 winged helix-turn-helix domain-containing protein [Bradyrhizobium liaoningense]MBR0859895.1 winged helix-turn-helix domain-containing protein [Bradyrhizobium liaoningense]
MPDRSEDSAISFGPFRLFPKSRLLEKEGTPLHVGGRALDILIYLAERPGEVIDKRELVKRIWANVNVDEGSLRFHVASLRKALGDTGKSARYVVNVPGRGYCFVASLAQATPPVSVDIAPPRSLPAQLAKMVGREEVIEKISNGLSLYRFMTVVGPGGIGKTAVAIAVGHRRSADFGGRVFFVDFGPLRDPGHVATTIASALGLAISAEDPSPALLTFLKASPALLIFDSCEHVLDTLVPLVERIVREAPQLRVLATSRESFRSEGERIFRLFPLDCPPERDGLNVADVLAYPAAQLFVERIAQSSGPFQLSAEEAPLVASICRRLDGIALAIELAAGRVNAYGIAGTASLLDSRFSLQWRGRRTAVPRHQTLAAALDWSYDLLPAAESATLRRLSVFVGPFAPEAAAAVASGDGLSVSETLEAIDSLVTKSLISPSGSRTLRYRLLDTTRTYALGKLNELGETRQFARRHAEHFRDFFERAEADTSTPLPEWLNVYGAELDNARAALDWALAPDGDAALGIALTAAAVTLWVRLSLFAECRERSRMALAALGDTGADDRIRMQLLSALGWSLMYGEGRAREARPILETTLELAEGLDDKDFRLRALWGLCIDQFNNGQFGKARALADRFADAAANSPDKTDLMLGDRLMAVALHYLGDQNDARLRIDRVSTSLHVLAAKPKIFPLDLRISTQYFRARILWLQGLADQARALAARNIEEGRANGHALTFCSVLGQAACPIAFWAGDLDAAERHGAELLEHTERHAIRLWGLWARAFNAAVTAKRGDVATGLPLLREELNRAGDARFLPRFLPLLGELAACFGEADQADRGLDMIEDILARCNDRQEHWYLPELIRIKGELMLKSPRHSSDADARFREAMDIAAQQGAHFWELRCAISLARSMIGAGRSAEARAVLDKVCGTFAEGSDIADMRIARELIAQLRT